MKHSYIPFFKQTLQLLAESKAGALAILKKGIPGATPEMIEEILARLTRLDPTTPKNKYIELFAKLLVEFHDPTATSNAALDEEMYDFQDFMERGKVTLKLKELDLRKIPFDISGIKTVKEFAQQLDKGVLGKSEGALSGLKEGKDYFDFGLITDKFGNTYKGYIPLNWCPASQTLASDRLGFTRGVWCTAHSEVPTEWIKHVPRDKELFVYMVVESHAEELIDRYKKFALNFDEEDGLFAVWDAKDKEHKPYTFFTEEQIFDIEKRMTAFSKEHGVL
jgi:hypothetical protein